jgi:hypothetical protein
MSDHNQLRVCMQAAHHRCDGSTSFNLCQHAIGLQEHVASKHSLVERGTTNQMTGMAVT